MNQRDRSKFQNSVLEKWLFGNFPFYDEIIYIDDSYLWSSRELKIKAWDLRLSLWNVLYVKSS